jgi:hypothetical protein
MNVCLRCLFYATLAGPHSFLFTSIDCFILFLYEMLYTSITSNFIFCLQYILYMLWQKSKKSPFSQKNSPFRLPYKKVLKYKWQTRAR